MSINDGLTPEDQALVDAAWATHDDSMRPDHFEIFVDGFGFEMLVTYGRALALQQRANTMVVLETVGRSVRRSSCQPWGKA